MSQHYLEYQFWIKPLQPASEILVAELANLGFESFVDQADGILAYIQQKDWHDKVLEEVEILKNQEFEITYEYKVLAAENWNATWESNFEPIVVGDSCRVRAPFHPKETETYDIVIEPKMSFGTGHHETTFMMLQLLLEFSCENLSVLDMGCGTGVLAILASMKGAKRVLAIDIDPWAYENTAENIVRNNQPQIEVRQGDVNSLTDEKFEIILANINRNILLDDIPHYAAHLSQGGLLFLSGFYLEDLSLISQKCTENKLTADKHSDRNNWVAAVYGLT